GRTFIMESQKLRDQGVMMKLSPIKAVIKDKRIILVDDSLVRGTTSKKIVAMMREAGAKEIHLRIACPEIIAPYFYGLDSYSADELISNRYNKDALCKHVGADTLEFLSIDGLDQSIEDVGLYLGCFNEDYPTHIYESEE
ncbi:MAG: amidophosphoribosyltransferase, partial [Erysipelothrix sp.]|nr:amidophosphoribosyltransferase [Erysipelothrix sp.]